MKLLVIPEWRPSKAKRYLLSDKEFESLMKFFTALDRNFFNYLDIRFYSPGP